GLSLWFGPPTCGTFVPPPGDSSTLTVSGLGYTRTLKNKQDPVLDSHFLQPKLIHTTINWKSTPYPSAEASSCAFDKEEDSMATATASLKRMYLDGKWCTADSGRTLAVINPATEEPLEDIAYGGRAETRRALEAAQRAMPSWMKQSAWDR